MGTNGGAQVTPKSLKVYEKNQFAAMFRESNPIRMRVGYQAAKEYADAHGIKIVNCTRGGMLETFKRMKLEDILKERN